MPELDYIIKKKREKSFQSKTLDNVMVDSQFMRKLHNRIKEESSKLLDDGPYKYRFPKPDPITTVRRNSKAVLKKVHHKMMRNKTYSRVVSSLRK